MNLGKLSKWRNHEFMSCSYRTSEYIEFERAYVSYFRRMCKAHGWKLTRTIKGHFEASLCIRGNNDKCVNILGEDVRWRPFSTDLIVTYREVVDENDYHGKNNLRARFYELEDKLQVILG